MSSEWAADVVDSDAVPARPRSAFIAGAGLVTPLGASLPETWDALLAGRFINRHEKAHIPSRGAAGLERLSNVSQLAVCAAREAALFARWEPSKPAACPIALVVGTSKGPIEQWIAPPASSTTSTSDKPLTHSTICGSGLHDVGDAVAAALRLPPGPRLTVSAACASGLHAMIRGAMMIQCGEAERVLVVAAEASVHPLFVGSFNRLGVLPPEGHGCRPYDRNRAGFLMSEAAAAVCLVAGETSRAVARIDRFGFGGDAFHLTGVDPQGRLLRRLLRHVIDGRPLDLVHGHGTGTELNDPAEISAFDDLLPRDAAGAGPTLYSHKGGLGHSLGASGLVSVVLNCKAAVAGIVPGNVRTTDPLPSRRLRIRSTPSEAQVSRSIAIAAGFGGATAVVGLSHLR
jgi:3-oxoacyl-[acyl-carrier-protein] synthase II